MCEMTAQEKWAGWDLPTVGPAGRGLRCASGSGTSIYVLGGGMVWTFQL